MAALFNNLIINMNSTRYRPFLFNLISGRRKLLSDNEFSLVRSMLKKREDSFTEDEHTLFCKLKSEKQFITADDRVFIEEKMIKSGHFEDDKMYTDDYSFSVDITRSCNIDCIYCYVSERINHGKFMTKAHLDGIYDFFQMYADDKDKIYNTPFIRLNLPHKRK